MQNKPKHRNVEKVEYLILNSVSHPQNETLGEKKQIFKKVQFPTYTQTLKWRRSPSDPFYSLY